MGSTTKSKKKTQCILAGGLIACAICLGMGVVLGVYTRPPALQPPTDTGVSFWSHNPSLMGYERQCRLAVAEAEECVAPLPRHHVAYKLAANQMLSIDGRLDDPAWQEVPWTEGFVDIRGLEFPVVKTTRAKLRYDSHFLYVGAWLQEDKLWGTYTQKDSPVFEENAFEIFFDVDRSMSMYKEIEINVINTTWDLMLSRAYVDGGKRIDWDGIAEKAVYTDGVPNNASQPATFWSVEMKFRFSALNKNTSRARPEPEPEPDEAWFMIMARSQYDVRALPNGSYAQVEGSVASWFSWQPIGAVNLHLPSRWGLLFFRDGAPSLSPTVAYSRWIVYQTLFDIHEAEAAYNAVTNTFSSYLHKLHLPPYVTSGCLQSVRVELTSRDNQSDYLASVISYSESSVEGHIRRDRFVWFT